MAIGKTLDEKTYAGDPHVLFDEGEVASVTPRRVLPFCDRRSFICLAGAAALGCAAHIGGPEFDENLAVLVSDPHVNGNPEITQYLYPLKWLVSTVEDILAMRPRPRHVLMFGDLAFDCGVERDYIAAREALKPLSAAGIKVVHCMGNHDRRLNFAKFFPEAASQTVVPGRFVTVVHFPHCDFIMLDSLKGDNDGIRRGPVEGELNEAEGDWLKKNLQEWERPVFLGAHHPIEELAVGPTPLKEFLGACPNFAGWIHGHDHRWLPNWCTARKSGRRTVRLLTLPSNGLWGDIGYALLRMNERGAVAELIQKDFWNPVPGQPSAEIRQSMMQGKAGQKCCFVFNPKV